MDNLFMFDAFKALDSLNEDTFKVDDEGIEELNEFEKMNEIDDSVEIIDMQAEDEEELEDSYIGKVVLACNVCDSKIFEDKENVVISEENPDSANTDMECPYCHTVDGFKIIGEIGEFHKHDDDDDKDEDEEEEIEDKEEEEIEVEDEEESENLEESKHKKFTDEDDIDADMDDEKEEAKKRWERRKNDARSKRDYRMKHDLEEDFKEASITTDREKMKMCSDENGKVTITTEPINSTEEEVVEDKEEVIVPVSDETEAEIETQSEEEFEAENSEEEDEIEESLEEGKIQEGRESPFDNYAHLDKDILSALNNKLVDWPTRGRLIKCGTTCVENALYYVSKGEDVRFNFGNISGSSDITHCWVEHNGVLVPTKAIDGVKLYEVGSIDLIPNDIEGSKRVIKKFIAANSGSSINEEIVEERPDEIDVDFDDIDEESFDELAESYLKTIYSNVESYKTTNASATKDKFMLEGLITFASGAVKNTNFVFAPKAATKAGKLQFIGENLQITKNRNAFKFNASIANKKLLGESLTYNYSTKDGAGKMRKLYGTIKRK